MNTVVSECLQIPFGGPSYLVPEASKLAPSAGHGFVSLDLRDRRLRAPRFVLGARGREGEWRGGTVFRHLRAQRRLCPLRLFRRICASLHADGSIKRDDCRRPSKVVETEAGPLS